MCEDEQNLILRALMAGTSRNREYVGHTARLHERHRMARPPFGLRAPGASLPQVRAGSESRPVATKLACMRLCWPLRPMSRPGAVGAPKPSCSDATCDRYLSLGLPWLKVCATRLHLVT